MILLRLRRIYFDCSSRMHEISAKIRFLFSLSVTCRCTAPLLKCVDVTKASKSNRTVVVSQLCVSTFHFTAFRSAVRSFFD